MTTDDYVYRQFAVLRQRGDGYEAEAGVRRVPVSEMGDDPSAYARSTSEAWTACEKALRAMAQECLSEAERCRSRATRSEEVTHGVA